jgi:hypothetical protein
MSLVVRLRAWVWLGAVVAALCVLLASSAASAQTSATISIGPGSPTRDVSINDRPVAERYFITRDDCQKDDTFEFKLNVSNPSKYTLFVYAGIGDADCSTNDGRDDEERRCFLLTEQNAEASPTIRLAARRIVYAVKERQLTVPNEVPASACEPNANTDNQSVSLYFLLFDGTQAGRDADGSTTFANAGVDLNGPSSTPGGFSARAGESQITVSWDSLPSGDFRTVRFFCERLDGSGAPVGNAGGAAGGSAQATSGGTGGTNAGTGGTPAGGGGGAGGANTGGAGGANTGGANAANTGGAAAASGGSGGAPAGSFKGCSSEPVALVPGQSPPSGSEYSCGSTVVPATRGVATPKRLTVGQTYAVAVALEDDVGNLGPLSSVVCVEPQPVTTFYERYDRAGGTSGGAFCSISHGRFYGPAILMLGAGVLLLAFRRRSRA